MRRREAIRSESESDSLSREEICHLLSSRRRRDVIEHLSGERSVPFNDLVDQVTAWEKERNEKSPDAEYRAAVYASLYQAHIPELVDTGVVAYDTEQRVTLTDRGRRLRAYLDVSENESAFWGRVLFAQSFLWIAVTLAAWGDLFGVGAISTYWIVAGCVGTFLGTSIAYAWRTRGRSIGADDTRHSQISKRMGSLLNWN